MDLEQFNTVIQSDKALIKEVYDFYSYLLRTERIAREPLPWSYTSEIINRLPVSHSMIDIGIDGGETLALLKPLPKYAVAYLDGEDYVEHIKKKLQEAGITYKLKQKGEMPFLNESFDTVIDRQGSYQADELHRILEPEGIFFTQQIGSVNDIELNKHLQVPINHKAKQWNLEIARGELESAGFEILDQQEAFSHTRFYDIGAVIYYLKNSPWQMEGFKIEKYTEQLLSLQQEIESAGFFEINILYFYIKAKKV